MENINSAFYFYFYVIFNIYNAKYFKDIMRDILNILIYRPFSCFITRGINGLQALKQYSLNFYLIVVFIILRWNLFLGNEHQIDHCNVFKK